MSEPIIDEKRYPLRSGLEFRSRRDRTDDSRVFEGLGDIPGPLLVLHHLLQVAPRHVEPHRIAEHGRHGFVGGNLEGGSADRNHQLDLVMIILRSRRIGDCAAFENKAGGRLGKIEGGDTINRVAELCGMRRVIASHTEDAVDRKAVLQPEDRNERRGWNGEQGTGSGEDTLSSDRNGDGRSKGRRRGHHTHLQGLVHQP